MRWLIILFTFYNLSESYLTPNDISSNSSNHSSPIGGPNVCRSRYRSYCCKGWQMKQSSGLCIIPMCTRTCGRGRCVKPDLCLCEGGHLAVTCPGRPRPDQRSSLAQERGQEERQPRPEPPRGDIGREPQPPPEPPRQEEGSCRVTCLNGATCSGYRCICKQGYRGENCAEPVCKDGCLNGGRCIAPNRCACVYGYTGRRCEADYRTGPCFTKVANGQCQGQLPGVVCTRNLCCATVGQAWGHPCEKCPSVLPCEQGFLKNIHSGDCVDINECDAIPGLCIGGKCVNTVGSFKCQCSPGQARDIETNACRDVNECKESDNLCENGRCVNTEGSYHCICNDGFIPNRDSTSCIDARQGYCYTSVTRGGVCINSLSMRLSKRDCCCGMNMGSAWGEDCEKCPLPGAENYKTLCGDSTTGGSVMTLVDECGLRPDICGGGRCIDTPDGYTCVCNPGYVKAHSHHCEDIDECLQGYCLGGNCVNAPGSFQCTCPPGFDVSSDGKRCIDHDECNQTGMCANGMCINMDGSFKCQCKPGFVLSSTGHACVDVDECYENPRICLNGRCENVPGSYRCLCQIGFTVSSDGAFCVDTDECASQSGMCQGGKCINTDGSFKCVCDVGYKLTSDKKSCVDIDECRTHNPPCQNGRCHNTVGSFFCECNPGFNLSPDGRSCVDTRKDLCYSIGKDGQCSNPSMTPVTKSTCCCSVGGQSMGWGTPCQPCPLKGSHLYQSLCPHGPGMTYNGDDINECAQNPNLCVNGACENMMGTHRCVCDPGFEVDSSGKVCVDIDECKLDDFICNGGQCRNTPGSFQCICPTGTQLNVLTHICEDVDECKELGKDACYNGECVNTIGSYDCECPPGTIRDHTGRVCIDNRKGTCWSRLVKGRCENNLPQVTLRSECCCSIGVAWGSPCDLCHHKDCACSKGYAKVDGKACTDINECELNAGVCRGGGTCVNTEGSFTCACPPGLILDSTGTMCIDIRQESCFSDFKHGVGNGVLEGLYPKTICCCSGVGKAWGGPSTGERCESCPKAGSPSFNDLCPKGPGFLDRKDINECTEFPGLCEHGRCKNSIGSFNCRCNQGYTLDENGIRCVDIDECSIMHGVCGNGTCHNRPGSFVCDCKGGFESSMMMQVCMDINECERTPGLCRGGVCRNTPGSFKCDCPPGLELAPDKKSCKDIDECSRTSGICSNGVCENMMGTYQCVCDDGYQHGIMKSHCEDIDECDERNGNCDGLCVNTPGSYSCACRTGFALQMDGRSCSDIDECKENPRICNGGQCTNTIGSFRCQCTNGLLPGPDGSSCIDINECEKENICGNGECENTVGSFRCHCEEGYSVKPSAGPQCTDEDECILMTNSCDINADCLNNPGSYSCRCRDGFTGDGKTCRDVNECLNNNGGCNQNARCINVEGSFRCECDSGFRGDGYACVDVDECTENPLLCENGHCLNYAGSFRCECEMGFMHPNDNSETSCVDINECQLFPNLCVHGRCENVFGMFRCECNEGYQIDDTGGNCTDINECESPQACQYGKCVNTQGSYICKCPPNYQLVPAGNACVDKRESRCYLQTDMRYGKLRCLQETGNPVTRATCCCSLGKAWGARCEACPEPGSDEFKTLCPGGIGYRPNKVTVVLEDINECEDHEELCKNGHCTNTFGSFMCSCNDGYRLNETLSTCQDINECDEIQNVCGVGFCVNDDGSYHCICPDGYMVLPNGKECVDMRKESCYMEYIDGQCGHPMTNQQTRMVCCCSMGAAWGSPCEPCPRQGSHQYTLLCGTQPGTIMNPMTNQSEEIDECSLMPTMCNHGACMNTPGSFECHCNRGFTFDVDAHQCLDENECIRTPSPCRGNAQCINTPGSFECQCPDGYKLSISLRDCTDVDECSERPGVCMHGSCNNFQGSFQCVCHNGYTLTPTRDSCVDIDECLRHPNICNNGSCTNTVGSYMCNCHAGFKLSHNQDCIDIDECHTMPFLCRNGRCRNTFGSFKCECADGYVLTQDTQHCRDLNECTEIDGTCPPPGRCQNTMGSFLCTCPPGYRLAPDKNSCIDINECAENRHICEGGVCINTEGGMICECPEGFVLSDSKIKCVDVRKELCYDSYDRRQQCANPRMEQITMKECCCSMGKAWGKYCNPCPSETSEEFMKLCPQGIGRGDSGEDINECNIMPDSCTGGDCINTDGSFRCECPQGYTLDPTGKKCIDENECITGNNICGNGTCYNIEGSFECNCNTGFAPGPMQTCEDVNECLEMQNQCAFRCYNVPGSFRCICPYGYSLAPDGRLCVDVDECATPANNCKFQCKNLIGSFMCVCPEGYTQAGMTDDCVDVDECSTTPGICPNGACVNLPGSYRCDCYPGYKPSFDSKKCLDERPGYCYRKLIKGRCMHTDLHKPVTKADCCCSMGAAWGPGCELCPSMMSQNYTELCLESGYKSDGNDVDECQTLPDLCKNGRCINTLGSYRCLCNKGYRADNTGTHCRDFNECEQTPSPCKFSCYNTEGSYRCSCPRGYKLASDGINCLDVDECATGQHICSHICINTPGSYQCSCPKGYNQQGDQCIDIDECKFGMGICPPPGTCINTLGSFRCLCPRGYKLDGTGTYCRDSNECNDDSKCQNGCQNKLGSYKCGCPEGFQQHSYYNQCVDENECSKNPCGNAKCLNTMGSFKCSCPEGQQFNDRLMICVEISAACQGSPCIFGCVSAGNSFACSCPTGYQRIAQGHCMSTINPMAGPGIPSMGVPGLPGIGGMVSINGGQSIGGGFQGATNLQNGQHQYPSEADPYGIPQDRLISTEGCFSCRTNGRHRRMTNHSRITSLQRSLGYFNYKNLSKHNKFPHKLKNGRHKRHHHGEHKSRLSRVLKVNLSQTKHRTRIIKLQPAIKNGSEYIISKGNDRNLFELIKKHGVWALHFRRRLKAPEIFHLEIIGKPKYHNHNEEILNSVWEEPVIIHVKLIVASS